MAAWDPQVNERFLQAVEIVSPDERRAFLDQACAGDADLRARVATLLQAGEQAGTFLESPAIPFGETFDQIGPYAIEGEIARGGMGVVLRAVDPRFGRTLALKILQSTD